MRHYLAILYMLSVSSSVLRASEIDFKEYEDIKKIKIMSDSSDIEITKSSSDNNSARVEYTQESSDPTSCYLTFTQNNDELVILNKKRETSGSSFCHACKVNFRISTPSSTDFEIETGIGNLSMKGMLNSLHFKSGIGDVKLDYDTLPEVSKEIRLDIGKGNVTASFVSKANLRAKVGIPPVFSRFYNEFTETTSDPLHYFVNGNMGWGNFDIKKKSQ
ncbi:MAG: hypothetical protein BGO77_04400 [Caedibacter sp. 37-49]|nr:MAG: hypothetical protein BGO77_04400 [Caedibacter sp. 37-49]